METTGKSRTQPASISIISAELAMRPSRASA